MPQDWKYPRYGESWSECSWCGQDYPSSQVWLNPRYGWQCYKCWDGLIQRDQILQPIFPYEGTRRTPAPTTQTLTQGIDGPVDVPFQWYFQDRITGLLYLVTLPPFTITGDGVLVYFTTSVATLELVTDTDDNPVFTGIRVFNGWDIYVRNGAVATELVAPDFPGIAEGICDFGTISSNCTIYMYDTQTGDIYQVDFDTTPPAVTAAPGATGTVFNAVQIGNGYYIVLNGVLTAYSSSPPGPVYANDCIQIDAIVGTPGGIPVEPPDVPPPALPVVTCPTIVVTGPTAEFTANVILASGATVASYFWDYGDGVQETTATGTASHVYSEAGTYFVALTVTDSLGRVGSDSGCPLTIEETRFCVTDVFVFTEDFDTELCETPELAFTETFET